MHRVIVGSSYCRIRNVTAVLTRLSLFLKTLYRSPTFCFICGKSRVIYSVHVVKKYW